MSHKLLRSNPASGPLSGMTVVDLTRALAGPHAAMMLGDLGANVIKVENPDGGDDTRGWGPPFVDPRDGDRESTYFLCTNRNKKSVTLDLKDDAGKAALWDLISRADVLMENFRPGVLERLGFSHQRLAEINPRLVVLSISGFGHDGPEAGRAGYDQIAQGEAGLMSVTGSGPTDVQRVGVPIADLLAGMYGAFGVLAALQERERTGRGQVVRASLLAAVVGVHAFQGTKWTVAGQVGEAGGNHHPSICPYGLFDTADGAVQIAVGSEGLWKRFCEGFGFDADAQGMASNPRAGGEQQAGQRDGSGAICVLQHRRATREAGPNRRAGRAYSFHPRGIRMGADPLSGPAHRRRSRDAGHHHVARSPAAVLRRKRH